MADFDKNMIFPPGLCGHFALGTLSKTYVKDAVFEMNVHRKKSSRKWQNPEMSSLTPKSKIVSELDIILHKLTYFYVF